MISVTVAGDFSPMNRVDDLIQRGKYEPFVISGGGNSYPDFFILNFESTIAQKDSIRIKKAGPHLKCNERTASYLKKSGVSVVTLANNHSMDYGEDGLINTIRLFQENGIKTVGAGHNLSEATKILYIKKEEETVAIINCCEHEFSYAEKEKAGANPLDPITQFHSIQEAKKNANYVLVIVHGGHEYYNLPSFRMVSTYRFFIDAGADAVVNHHQHCYSGYEYYKGKPIYYGLGNFCFDWPGKSPSFYTGFCVKLSFGDVVSSEELPYTQCVDNPLITFGDFDGFREELKRINDIISNPGSLNKDNIAFYNSKKNDCIGVMTPFGNRYLNALVRRGLIPAMIREKKKLLWKAYVDCESHRDTMLNYLKDYS